MNLSRLTIHRDLYRDLVDKPPLGIAAVLLVLALIAVPTMLSKSPAPAPSPAPAAAAAVPAPAMPPGQVSVALPRFRAALQAGGLKDPFVQQHTGGTGAAANAPLVSTLSSAPPTSTGSGGSGGSGSLPSGGGGGVTSAPPLSPTPPPRSTPPASAPRPTPAPPAGTIGADKIEVRFGKATGALVKYSMVANTALPSNTSPILIYLGLENDGKTAAFLLSSDTNPQGDATCKPSRAICTTILMRPGDSEFLDVGQSGRTVQYQLDYVASR